MENDKNSNGRFKLYDEMELREFQDRFVIKPLVSGSNVKSFFINRSDGSFHLENSDTFGGNPIRVSTVCGLVGTIRLLAGTYLLIITSRKEVGSYLGFPIFQVKSMRFLACNEVLKLSSSQEKKDEAYFMSLLRTVESTPGLYYSYETDLTLSLQRTCELSSERTGKPLWKQADPRFIWNQNLLEELIEYKLDEFVIPLVQGSFHIMEFMLKSSMTRITLLSRRCTRRLGTRMWRRGANLDGDTANFVETEQILEFEGFKSSFLQVRGSIPILWEQIVDLSYKPHLNIITHEETPKVVQRHFHALMQTYGEIISVDLTDKNGDEGKLSMTFAIEMQRLPHIRYVPFDFHQLCKNDNLENIQLLYDEIAEDIDKQGFFLMKPGGKIVLRQKGVVRTNCIDCLDRTNVTQCYLAEKSINLQLQKLDAISPNDFLSMYSNIYESFKLLWAEHGDELSIEYAGTHALKGDLVRYGKQTFVGRIKDGMSALSRYYLNNFHDGLRQDAMDLISGRYTVRQHSPSQFQLNRYESFSYLPMASALIVGGITATTLTLNQAGRNAQYLITSVLWAGLTVGAMALVKANGRQFCSKPRLCSLL